MKNQTHRILAISMVAIMLAMLVPMTAEPASAAGESWLDGWPYRAAAPINAASGAGAGYQVLFHLYAGTGTNTAGTYHGTPTTTIYANGHAKADWGDIRFTAADGVTLLPYWVESSSSSEAVVWVKLSADISSAGTTVYCYYGNSAASSQSNGAATFVFFDDFSSLSAWTQSGTVTVAGGQVSIGTLSAGGAIASSALYGLGYAVNYRAYFDGRSDATASVGMKGGEGASSNSLRLGCWYNRNMLTGEATKNGAYSWIDSSISESSIQKAWHDYGIVHLADKVLYTYDGATIVTRTTYIPTADMSLYAGVDGHPITVDSVRVRKAVLNEPTHGTPGAEIVRPLEFTSAPSVSNIIKTVDGRTITASVVAENYTSIVWDMGDNTTYSGVTEVRHTYADNGTYTVTVTAYDWLGQEASTSTAVKIGDDAIPVIGTNGAGMAMMALAGSFALALGAIAKRPVVLLIGIAAIIIAALLALGVL